VLKDLQAHKGSKVLKVVEEPQEHRVPKEVVVVVELKEPKVLKEPQDQQGLQIVD
jgi:hypothetical protein